ncbi:MAG: bifunctional homocysteine S-methyltransferase/methylenetetrahydrofolate reductase [Syntrophotaleaceae bacterium]
MNPKHVVQMLREQVLVGDGAMGTQLYSRGVPLEVRFESLNLTRPELVAEIHRSYVAAGARLLETNSFAANAPALATAGLEKKVREVNRAAARLARGEAGDKLLVAGSVGPLLRPRGEAAEGTVDRRAELFRAQMEGLAKGGVDLFLLETFSELEELLTALQVAKELSLPVIAQMAFFEDGRTRHGITAEEAARRLEDAGADAVGANCGSGPRELLLVLKRMAGVTQLPLAGFANSGFPQFINGRYIYLATPEYFAHMGQELVQVGATLVGGCCGTTPGHIRHLAAALANLQPAVRQAEVAPLLAPRSFPPPAERPKSFLDNWGKRPVVTVEIGPPKGLDCSKVLQGSQALAKAGADAISLTENPLARIRMGNIALARLIQEGTGIEVIIHMTGRDRNLIGLHSDLMGAHLLGIRNVLAVTGDPVPIGGESGATSVFDLNSIGILELLQALNRGTTLLGADIGGRTGIVAGAAFNPNVKDIEGQIRKLEKKIAAGACFVETQPVFSPKVMEEMLERLAPLQIPVLVGLMPLVSERNAEFLHNEVPGIRLSDDIRRRMRGTSGMEGIREGLAIARELIDAGGSRTKGYTLMPPFGKIELALELLQYIKGRRS